MDRNELLNDPEAAMRAALDGRQSTLWTALPGIVTAVDFDEMTVKVQPAIQAIVLKEDGTEESVNLPELLHVPLVFPSGGGFLITMPVAAGDEVLVVWASRCVDAWWQSSGVQRPMEARMHDLSDGFAIPGPRSVPKVPAGLSSSNLQIRNDAGTTMLELTPSGAVTLKGSASVTIQAPAISLIGAVTVTGALTAGAIGATSATIGGIPFSSHKHTGVTTGAGQTGGPV